MNISTSSPLWVVTPYFNPCKYRSRWENFHNFRKQLRAPLLVVELEKTGNFDVSEDYGDIVLHLQGEDSIWQKERLINVGIAALPTHVKYVAWIDCDIIFENEHWVDEAIAKLTRGADMVQLFSSVMHQSKQQSIDNILINPASSSALHEIGIAKYLSEGGSPFDSVGTSGVRYSPDLDNNSRKIKPAIGHAWAASVDRKNSRQLYDANIVGGGDRVDLVPILSRIDELKNFRPFSPAQYNHLHEWAAGRPSGRLDFVEGRIFHLWHGEFTNRQYNERHHILRRHNFDPNRDIQLAPNGTWRWTDPEGQLAKEVAVYFRERREDG